MNSTWMNRAGLLLLSLGVPAAVVVGSAACGDTPCEQLADYCVNCVDATYRASCDELVDRDVYDTCDAQLDTFAAYCPEGATAPTSTVTDTTTSPTSSTSSGTTNTTTASGGAGGGATGGAGGAATGGAGGTGGTAPTGGGGAGVGGSGG